MTTAISSNEVIVMHGHYSAKRRRQSKTQEAKRNVVRLSLKKTDEQRKREGVSLVW